MARAAMLMLAIAFGSSAFAARPEPVNLGTAANFGALAGAAISGTGEVKGDVGSGSGAIAPAITSTGIIYPMGDAVAVTALADVSTAYLEAKNRPHDILLSAAAFELGGKTLTPGVYKIGAAATLASPLTLNGQGDPNAVFIIQITGALGATAAVGNVVLSNDAQSKNVYWIVEGAVSMGAGTHMEGTILGGAAVSFGATTTIHGRVMAGSVAGTIALATTVTVPVEPSVIGDRVWFDANGNGIQDASETTGFPNVPVTLLQLVLEKTTIELGAAANFGALAGAAISGSGNVVGNVGSGTGAIAPAITSTGSIYSTGHAMATTALADFATAYNNGKNRAPDVLLSAAAYELGGSTLTPGVYKIGAAATLASPMTLDAEGDPEGVFIIQIVGAFGTTASTGNVVLTNQAKSANVFWVVEGAVSVGAGAHMEGNILGGAAITFGASTTISGRVLAGAGAGTIALSTTFSAITGTPPAGFPPPIVAANTVTDASGKYLFKGVQPGTYVVRWNLSGITTDYATTSTKQGSDGLLDSDSASGDVGGFVHATEIVVLGGTTHLGVDLGLLATLPAIKVAARNELTSALAAYLLASSFSPENWTALMTVKTDGDIAIGAAADPEGVAAAKNAALAALDAVPTFAETLAAAKAAAFADLASALASSLEANYTPANWIALVTAKTNSENTINAATNLAGVEAAKNSALLAMDAVATITETLAAAKASALQDLATTLAIALEANFYTAENWAALKAAKTDGDTAINAATDLAGIIAAKDAALAAMSTVPSTAEKPIFTTFSRNAEGEVTMVLQTAPNVLLTLQTSTDLEIWSTIATATPVTEVWTFVHAATLATGDRRFYRAFLNR